MRLASLFAGRAWGDQRPGTAERGGREAPDVSRLAPFLHHKTSQSATRNDLVIQNNATLRTALWEVLDSAKMGGEGAWEKGKTVQNGCSSVPVRAMSRGVPQAVKTSGGGSAAASPSTRGDIDRLAAGGCRPCRAVSAEDRQKGLGGSYSACRRCGGVLETSAQDERLGPTLPSRALKLDSAQHPTMLRRRHHQSPHPQQRGLRGRRTRNGNFPSRGFVRLCCR